MARSGHPGAARGFSLIELVMLMVVIGILAAIAIPRFASRSLFDAAGFAEDSRAVLRYAQKLAIAQHRSVSVNLDASGQVISACFDTAYPCAAVAPDPTTGNALTVSSPSGVTFTTSVAQLTYDWRGSPNGTAANLTITPSSGSSVALSIDGDTGYVQ